MRLVRYGPAGEERPGLIDAEGRVRDLSARITELAGPALADLDALSALDPGSLPLVAGSPRLGVPVSGVRKIIAMGFNYADHAAESEVALPTEPLLFSKAITALSGPFDEVVMPRGATKLDYEAELVIVIGKAARYVSEADALGHVAGFAVGHDVSERAFQRERGGQYVKGKSADTFAPVGPWLVPTGSVGDVQALAIRSKVNGDLRQDSNTRYMVFSAAFAVSYISRFMTLEAGDLIFTGTPAGVGAGMEPPAWLEPGDVVEVSIEGLGTQRQTIAGPR
ncbi:MAG: fumarylacetoacetate hydrolase family protein [Pseudomonadota bacterium]|nr:fumarylacetoacetate hydrolase family protein [Pseudomonadota bacterium]